MHFTGEQFSSNSRPCINTGKFSQATRKVFYVSACLLFIFLLNLCFNVRGVIAPPVDTKQSSTLSPEEVQDELAYRLEYEKYLREVVEVLEANPEIRNKIENASQDDIKSGKIAEDIDFARFPDIRSKLDEAKRTELERLGSALKMQRALENGDSLFPNHVHNMDAKFNKDDLKKLIIEATKDLERLDQERREKFKRQQMRRSLDEKQALEAKTGDEREKLEKEILEQKRKLAEHEPLDHPMSKKHMEKVWEDEDKLSREDFNATTFFNLHDLNGDGFLDELELKALFQIELDKAYKDNNSTNTAADRDEEEEKMREHVMTQLDKNKDRMIDFDEFMSNSNSPDYVQDPEWETLDKQPASFDDEEFKEYERQMQQATSSMNGQKVVGEPPASRPHPSAGGDVKDNSINNYKI